MGLFDFVRNIGTQLFSNDAEAATKIKEHILADGLPIENLEVGFDDGRASLAGQAADAPTREKAILLAGNAKGVESVEAEGLTAPAPSEEVEYYVIKSGDSLSKIAKRYYGNAMDYPRIFEANREVIKDPDLIFPGQKIRIPLGGKAG